MQHVQAQLILSIVSSKPIFHPYNIQTPTQASISVNEILCRSCDSKVHSANFLVARHLRSLPCQVCQSLTPWKASREKLAPTVSICERCIGNCNGNGGGGGVDQDEESEGGNDELELLDDEESEDEIEEEDEENQVVPWTSSTPPPPPSSSSSDDEYSSCGGGDEDDQEIDRDLSLKHLRKNIVETAREASSSSSSSSSRRSKQQKREVHITRSDSEESVAIVASLNELQKRLVGKKG